MIKTTFPESIWTYNPFINHPVHNLLNIICEYLKKHKTDYLQNQTQHWRQSYYTCVSNLGTDR